MRVNSRWNARAKSQSLVEIAGAVSFICWKIATNAVLELENQGCQTTSNAHRLQIIGEFMAFLLQVTDRLSYETLATANRQSFITALAQRMIDTYTDNQRDVLGPGEYRASFIHFLNQRINDYSELSFQHGEAGFDFLRYFGEQVEALLKEKPYVSQQIMSVAGPQAIKTLAKGLQDLFE